MQNYLYFLPSDYQMWSESDAFLSAANHQESFLQQLGPESVALVTIGEIKGAH